MNNCRLTSRCGDILLPYSLTKPVQTELRYIQPCTVYRLNIATMTLTCKRTNFWLFSVFLLLNQLGGHGVESQGTSVTADPPGMHWTLFPLFGNQREKRDLVRRNERSLIRISTNKLMPHFVINLFTKLYSCAFPTDSQTKNYI